MTQKNSLVTSLTYLGAIPFLVAALCSLLGVNELPYLGATQPLLFSYATLIASFMAGTHWGYVVRSNSTFNLILFASVITVLILWILWSSSRTVTYPLFLVPIYLLLLGLDYLLLKYNYEERFYFKMRTGITSLVILSLLVCYFKQ